MMVRKSVRRSGFGFDRYDAMTPMTPMTRKRRWFTRVGFRAEGELGPLKEKVRRYQR